MLYAKLLIKRKGGIMAIKEAKQSGSNVIVKCGNSTTTFSGKLIGYTSNAVFIQNGRNLQVFIEHNGNVVSSGVQISLSGNEDIRMYSNQVGIKRGATIHLYGENGKPAGTRPA